jgi:hypothetical protein
MKAEVKIEVNKIFDYCAQDVLPLETHVHVGQPPWVMGNLVAVHLCGSEQICLYGSTDPNNMQYIVINGIPKFANHDHLIHYVHNELLKRDWLKQ